VLLLKNRIIGLIFLILILGGLVISRVWFFDQNESGDSATTERPAATPTPSPGSAPDTSEEERLAEEQREAERLEAERLEAEQREAEIIEKRAFILEEGRLLLRGYFFDEAIALLNADHDLVNNETQALEDEIVAAKNSLVRFEGDVKHIFFHSLVLYPEVLFPDLSVPTGGYNEGFIFRSEFLKILPQLMERGYVLFNINDVFSKDDSGTMRKKDIYLPPGKKPLILSMDDPTLHYGQRFAGGGGGATGGFDRSRNPTAGFATRVVFDEYGELATEVMTPSGEIIITYDGDVHVALDAFVKEHPEFSYRGHKGIIAATGYMGIFGYDLPDLRNEETRQKVIAICDKMKENGWLFASHSYSHNRVGFWGPETNPNSIRWDTRRWKEEMEPIVGQTNLFIAPYGHLLTGDAMQVILDNGFDIYCTVDFNQRISVYTTHAVMGRIEIGGYALVRYTNTLDRDFFDVASVKDPHRPPILSR